MLDDSTRDLIDRLFRGQADRRSGELETDLKAIVNDAVRRGILGAGFFHSSLADRLAQELRIRADDLWETSSRVLASSSLELDSAAPDLKELLRSRVYDQSLLLQERLRRDLERFGAQPRLIAKLTDAEPKICDGLFAQVDLMVKEASRFGESTRAPLRSGPFPDATKVFVVHGRDDAIKAAFFAFLRSLGLHPLEWSEAIALTGKGSPYIGEVLDKAFGSAQAIVALLSPDDEVRLHPALWAPDEKPPETESALQPRPNVLFETGMAFGRSPDRTVIVQVGDVKQFSDVAGRHVVRLTNDEPRRRDLLERLKTAGCSVATPDDSWLSIGDFSIRRAVGGASPTTPLEPSTSSAARAVKYVDLNYPHDSGFQGELEANGYRVAWCKDSQLARKLDIDGWELAYQTDKASGRKVVLKLKDRPEDHTLVRHTK